MPAITPELIQEIRSEFPKCFDALMPRVVNGPKDYHRLEPYVAEVIALLSKVTRGQSEELAHREVWLSTQLPLWMQAQCPVAFISEEELEDARQAVIADSLDMAAFVFPRPAMLFVFEKKAWIEYDQEIENILISRHRDEQMPGISFPEEPQIHIPELHTSPAITVSTLMIQEVSDIHARRVYLSEDDSNTYDDVLCKLIPQDGTQPFADDTAGACACTASPIPRKLFETSMQLIQHLNLL